MDHAIEGTEQLLDRHLELQRRRLVLVVRDDDPAAVVSEFLHLLENQYQHLLIATALALEVERSLRARGAYDPDALRDHVTHTAVLREIIHRSQREVEMRRLMVGRKTYHQTTHLYFSLASVDNFAKNGRVSHVIAKGIRIVGTAGPEGTLDFKGKCRGDKKVLVLILKKMKELGYNGGRVIIAHNQNEAAALQLKMPIEELFGTFNGVIHPERALCCYYAEPGSVMVGFEA